MYDVRLRVSLTPIYPYIPAPAPGPLAYPRRRENDRVVAGRVVIGVGNVSWVPPHGKTRRASKPEAERAGWGFTLVL